MSRTTSLDLLDRDALVKDTLPLVRHIVADVASRVPRFVDREDLLSAGMLGLAQAAKAFDPERGVTFQTFARGRVKGAVLDELRSRDWASRATRGRARLMQTATSGLVAELGRTPTITEVAERMGVSRPDVERLREDVGRAANLERPSATTVGDDTERAASNDAGPEAQLLDRELRAYLRDAVCALPERLQTVVVGYFFEGREMQEIALELGVTASRISQLCAEALALLKDGINAQLEPKSVSDLDVTTGRVGRRKAAYYASVAGASSYRSRLDRRAPQVIERLTARSA